MAVRTQPLIHRIPITKARHNLGQVVRRAHLNKEYFILEKDGIPVAGIMGANELEDYLEIQDPKLRKQIEYGHREYRQGEATPFDDFLVEIRGKAKKRRK